VANIYSEGLKIMYRKKTTLNSKLILSKDLDQEKICTTKETHVSSLVGNQTTLSPTTSTTSQDQQQVMQTSKFITREIENSIFYIFKEIKVRNEALKINTDN